MKGLLEVPFRVHGLPESIQWVVIDEIQRIPKLLDLVHHLIETTSIQFALTGSSSRKLKRGAANLLAGRAFVYHLHPFTSIELGDRFDLLQSLQWGTLPKIFQLENHSDKEAFLRSYTFTYLREEIVAEQIVRKLDPFRLFLEVAAQSNGQIINFTRIAEDTGVDTKTVQTYFEILEDTLIGFLLPPFDRSIRKRQRTNPKFYYFDVGVQRSLARTLQVPLQEGSFAYGNAFEHFLIAEIRRLLDYLKPDWRMFYLRTKDDAEIDLILERPGESYLLIEIKSTNQVGARDCETLQRFIHDFPNANAFCISRDIQRKQIGDVTCQFWRDFINQLFNPQFSLPLPCCDQENGN